MIILIPIKQLIIFQEQSMPAGITYSFKKNIKLLVNYVYKDYDGKPDRNAIMIGTRLVL